MSTVLILLVLVIVVAECVLGSRLVNVAMALACGC